MVDVYVDNAVFYPAGDHSKKGKYFRDHFFRYVCTAHNNESQSCLGNLGSIIKV